MAEMLNDLIIHAAVIAMLTLFFVVARYGKATHTDDGELIVQYSGFMKWSCMGLVGFATLGVTAAVLTFPVRSTNDLIIVVCLYFAIALFGVYFYIEFFTSRILVTEIGIVGTSGWCGRREVVWSDISEITYSTMGMYFTIRSNLSAPVRIHAMMTGVPQFQSYYEAMLPQEMWRAASNAYNRIKGALEPKP